MILKNVRIYKPDLHSTQVNVICEIGDQMFKATSHECYRKGHEISLLEAIENTFLKLIAEMDREKQINYWNMK